MAALLAIALLLFTAVAVLLMRLWRPGFGVAWLAAALGSLAAWGLGLAAWFQAPRSFTPFNWQASPLMPASPALILDSVSWPYLLALLSLNLAVVLAGVHRLTPEGRIPATRTDLAAGLALTAAAGLAALSGNLLTLLLLWAAVDLTQALIWVGRARDDAHIEQAAIALTVRLASHLVLVWGGMAASRSGASTQLAPASAAFTPFLITAAGLRLGVLPPRRPLPAADGLAPGLRALGWLAPAAAALAALERAAAAGPSAGLSWYILFCAGAILYAGWQWLNARSGEAGLPHFLLGFSALALAGAARGLPFAGMAWGLAGLLAGGVMALLGPRTRGAILPLIVAGVFAAGLPFTPSWPGVALFAWPFPPLSALFLPGLGLLLAGYLRQALKRAQPAPMAERWVWLIYPLGLAALPAAHAFIAVMLRPGAPGGLAQTPGILASGLSLMAVGLAVLAVALLGRRRRRARRSPNPAAERILPLLEWTWLYRLAWGLYQRLGRAAERLAWALEGRAGLLWALLALALLLSLLAQFGMGG